MTILSINLFSVLSMLAVVVSKSLYSMSKAIIIAIVSHEFLLSIIATLSYLHRYSILAKISNTDLLNPLALWAAG